MELLLGGIVGALLSSFIALAAERYSFAATAWQWWRFVCSPPSHCAHCLHALRWRDLIPLYSWIRLGGRCRYCHYPLPVALLLLEVIGTTLFALQSYAVTGLAAHLCRALFTMGLLLLAEIDRRNLLLPDLLTLPLLWLGLLYNCGPGAIGAEQAVAGAVTGYLSFALLAEGWKLFRGECGLGYGDVKLFAALGAWLGVAALPAVALIAALSGLAIVCVKRCRAGRSNVNLSSPQPFGPCLAAAGWIVMIEQTLTRPALLV